MFSFYIYTQVINSHIHVEARYPAETLFAKRKACIRGPQSTNSSTKERLYKAKGLQTKYPKWYGMPAKCLL